MYFFYKKAVYKKLEAVDILNFLGKKKKEISINIKISSIIIKALKLIDRSML